MPPVHSSTSMFSHNTDGRLRKVKQQLYFWPNTPVLRTSQLFAYSSDIEENISINRIMYY